MNNYENGRGGVWYLSPPLLLGPLPLPHPLFKAVCVEKTRRGGGQKLGEVLQQVAR